MKTRAEANERRMPPPPLAEATGERAPKSKKTERYREIGHELQRMFNDVLSEPIPDDLLALVKKLEEQSGGGGSEPQT